MEKGSRMNIQDLYQQREGVWHNITITYITVGEATQTKPDQNEFDQQKQLVYFMDDDGKDYEMTVYVADTPQSLEYIDPKVAGTRAVFKIKHKDKFLTGILTDKKPDVAKATGPDWDAIAYGKTKCRIVCSAIESKQIECKNPEQGAFWANIIFEPRKEQENESEY
ncbi:hypothetical protein LCGC14_2633410 [marine sediment metagenome]|uniref:Uncharacterized protein n=1 Tax=marine sediment metagenome TaxID=412755 RepID=A0A0F9AM86_9ZZZZ